VDRKTLRTTGLALVVHAAVTAYTWHDLNRRSDAEIRGSKRLWRFASGLNTLGTLAYFTVGRKSGPSS
jgi:hypothetical protein